MSIILLILYLSFCFSQDCEEGYTYILELPGSVFVQDISNCFYQSDLDVFQIFIYNSQSGSKPPPSDLLPIELGHQIWENGRLINFAFFCQFNEIYAIGL